MNVVDIILDCNDYYRYPENVMKNIYERINKLPEETKVNLVIIHNEKVQQYNKEATVAYIKYVVGKFHHICNPRKIK